MKVNFKWIKDSNMKPETLKMLKENIGSNLQDVGIGKGFLNRTLVVQEIRLTINKWDVIKLKSFCIAKTNKQTNEQTNH